MASLIYDGLTEKGYIAAVPRVHGEMRFEFRPATNEMIGGFLDGLKNRSTKALGREEAKIVAGRLVSWSLADKEGEPLPINQSNVWALHPLLFRRLKEITFYGGEGGDADPEAPDDDLMDMNAEAANTGKRVTELREERDVKN
jgi:hypothetical protein